MSSATRTVTLPQGPIRYRDVGGGEPVVFVHGLLASSTLWAPVVERLSATHRCIAPDWPLGSHTAPMNEAADLSPHGQAVIVADFLAALDLDGVTLVGNDSGGAISQLVAAYHNERLARLVLTNCDAFEVFPPEGFGYLRWLSRIPGLTYAIAKAMHAIPAMTRLPFAYGALTHTRLPDATIAAWVAPAARDRRIRRDAAKFVAGIDPRVTIDVAADLQRFERPVLLAWGERDRFFRVELAHRLRDAFPDARFEGMGDASVYVALDQPERLAAAIARFTGERAHVTTAA